MEISKRIKVNKPHVGSSLLYSVEGSGRIIYRDKIDTLIGVKHPGIILGKDEWGTTWVIHNHYENGKVEVVTYENFSKGEAVFYDNRKVDYNQSQIIERAIDAWLNGTVYHWLLENCQHFVSSVTTRSDRRSESVDQISTGVVVTGGILTLLGLVTKSKALTNLGGITLGTGVLTKAISR